MLPLVVISWRLLRSDPEDIRRVRYPGRLFSQCRDQLFHAASPVSDLRRGKCQPSPHLANLCPPVYPRDICAFNSFSSQLDSTSVRHTALSLISVVLKRALKTVDHCLNKEVWQESGVYTAVMMEEFVQLFREALSKVGSNPGLGFPSRPHQVEKAVLGAQGRKPSDVSLEPQGWMGQRAVW